METEKNKKVYVMEDGKDCIINHVAVSEEFFVRKEKIPLSYNAQAIFPEILSKYCLLSSALALKELLENGFLELITKEAERCFEQVTS